jgi:ribosomal protection tetracycline resistance protein
VETLNLGILAHVDAGKTSLTERLLYEAGVIDRMGSVDKGDTQTDNLSIERQRGITVRSAVVLFQIDDVSVNLIDTPGHPDFIAEVERVLRILDGAVLVLSAVEGVQPQTRVLMRALGRLGIPTLLFVNKIDREGAREESLLRDIRRTLGLTIPLMGSTTAIGTHQADFALWDADDSDRRALLVDTLGAHDEQLLSDYLEHDGRLPPERLRRELKAQTQQGLVHPVFFGSARTGGGVRALMSGIADLLPAAVPGDSEAPTSGTVFKIERGDAREKIAYVRLFSGTVRTRDQLVYGRGREDKVVAIAIPDGRSDPATRSVAAGNIVKIWGLRDVQIGDRIGQAGTDESDRQFAPPTMESYVQPRHPADGARLRSALAELAEQDPLIRVRRDDARKEISVSLYGEVQKEIIESSLALDYGLEVDFLETMTVCIERPARSGEATELLTSDANPYMATLGIRIEPGPQDGGIKFALDVDERSLPLYIYKSEDRFVDHMTQYVNHALRRGLFGWQVTDCAVTLTSCGYYVGDGPTKPNVPMARTASADFRSLTPLVLSQAVERAGTRVCEPMLRLKVELPSAAIGDLLQAIARLTGSVEETRVAGEFSTVEARLPADRLREFQTKLPRLSGGEGSFESAFDGYQPVVGTPPKRTSNLGGGST